MDDASNVFPFLRTIPFLEQLIDPPIRLSLKSSKNQWSTNPRFQECYGIENQAVTSHWQRRYEYADVVLADELLAY
jgi:hypothetical protein